MICAMRSDIMAAYKEGGFICRCGFIYPIDVACEECGDVRESVHPAVIDQRVERTCNYCRRRFMRLMSKSDNVYANYCQQRCVERMRIKLGLHWELSTGKVARNTQ